MAYRLCRVYNLNKGLKTLYFVARDSYILKIMVDKYIKYKNLDIKTKYIYGSRKSFRVIFNKGNAFDFLINNLYGVRTLKQLVLSVGISEEFLLKSVPEIKSFASKKMCHKYIKKIIKIMLANEDFISYLEKEVFANKLLLVKEYLLQEINFDEKFAFIDFHGTGFTANAMDKIIEMVHSNANYYHIFFNLENHFQKSVFIVFLWEPLYMVVRALI